MSRLATLDPDLTRYSHHRDPVPFDQLATDDWFSYSVSYDAPRFVVVARLSDTLIQTIDDYGMDYLAEVADGSARVWRWTVR